MIYYILLAYVLVTLWFSTNCSECYFSKTHHTIINERNHSFPIIKTIHNNSISKKYFDTYPVRRM